MLKIPRLYRVSTPKSDTFQLLRDFLKERQGSYTKQVCLSFRFLKTLPISGYQLQSEQTHFFPPQKLINLLLVPLETAICAGSPTRNGSDENTEDAFRGTLGKMIAFRLVSP